MRQKIGIAFLIVTIGCVTTAINQGGYWWAAVAVASLVTLWGIGFKKPKSDDTK